MSKKKKCLNGIVLLKKSITNHSKKLRLLKIIILSETIGYEIPI